MVLFVDGGEEIGAGLDSVHGPSGDNGSLIDTAKKCQYEREGSHHGKR